MIKLHKVKTFSKLINGEMGKALPLLSGTKQDICCHFYSVLEGSPGKHSKTRKGKKLRIETYEYETGEEKKSPAMVD